MMRVADLEVGAEITCSKHGGPVFLTEYMLRAQTRICPACQSKAAVQWARTNRQRKREANAQYHSRISGSRAAKTKQYRERHPDRQEAHQAVQTALRNGALIRDACIVCGSEKTHAHHDDYSKPLLVTWLCHAHHMERHAMLKAREAQS